MNSREPDCSAFAFENPRRKLPHRRGQSIDRIHHAQVMQHADDNREKNKHARCDRDKDQREMPLMFGGGLMGFDGRANSRRERCKPGQGAVEGIGVGRFCKSA